MLPSLPFFLYPTLYNVADSAGEGRDSFNFLVGVHTERENC